MLFVTSAFDQAYRYWFTSWYWYAKGNLILWIFLCSTYQYEGTWVNTGTKSFNRPKSSNVWIKEFQHWKTHLTLLTNFLELTCVHFAWISLSMLASSLSLLPIINPSQKMGLFFLRKLKTKIKEKSGGTKHQGC